MKKTILSIIIILMAFACTSNSIEQKNINLVKAYYEFVNSGDTISNYHLISEDFTKINNERVFELKGQELVRNSIISHMAANSEYKFHIDDMFASENRVSVRWTWKSINIKSNTPKPVISKGIAIFEIQEGKITKLWQTFDLQSFMNQLK